MPTDDDWSSSLPGQQTSIITHQQQRLNVVYSYCRCGPSPQPTQLPCMCPLVNCSWQLITWIPCVPAREALHDNDLASSFITRRCALTTGQAAATQALNALHCSRGQRPHVVVHCSCYRRRVQISHVLINTTRYLRGDGYSLHCQNVAVNITETALIQMPCGIIYLVNYAM